MGTVEGGWGGGGGRVGISSERGDLIEGDFKRAHLMGSIDLSTRFGWTTSSGSNDGRVGEAIEPESFRIGRGMPSNRGEPGLAATAGHTEGSGNGSSSLSMFNSCARSCKLTNARQSRQFWRGDDCEIERTDCKPELSACGVRSGSEVGSLIVKAGESDGV